VLVDKRGQQGFKCFCEIFSFKADDPLFSLSFKQDLAVGTLLGRNIHFLHVWLAHIFDMLGGDRKKYRNPEPAQSTWKVFVATQRQHC